MNSNTERMVSVTIDNDIESQQERTNLESPLRSILKKPEEDYLTVSEIKLRIIKICLIILFIICYFPFIITDLHYGIMDNECINTYPKDLNINLKIYLIVSGFMILFNLLIVVLAIIYIPVEMDREKYKLLLFISKIFGHIFTLVNFIWNLLGVIIFWAFIYGQNICNSNISTYLFVSFIIKILANISVTIFRFNI